MLDYFSDTGKHAVDALSVGTIIASLFSLLPQVSALLAAIWFAMRIYEAYLNVKLAKRKLK